MQINASIANLIGGVSQQPDVLRSPSQMKSLENATCDAARGLSKRPPTDHRAILPAFGGDGLYRIFEFEGRGAYHLQIKPDSSILMSDDLGNPVTILDEAGSVVTSNSYLESTDPASSLRVVKEADTLFLLNTTKTVSEIVTPATGGEWPAIIWVKTGNYGRDYTVSLEGTGSWTYTTPTGSDAAHINQTKTDLIAGSLGTQMAAAGVPGVTVTGSVIHIAQGSSGLTVKDSQGDSAIGLVYRSVRSIADLPSRNVPNGFYVKVEGGDGTADGDFYVIYDAGSRVWRETRHPKEAWGVPHPSLMPHRLVPETATVFRISSIPWLGRLIGDESGNPKPDFVGKQINDLFFHQDRLGLLAGETVNLSEVGRYFNFYRTTVRDLLDTDPVTATVSHPKVSILRHAVPFRKRLLLFSDKAQFEVQGGEVLTPRSVSTPAISEFESGSRVRPRGVGASLYFPADRGSYSAIYNFSLLGDVALEQAADVTAHVPQYIPRGITHLEVSPVNNMLFALSSEEPRYLYVYQFYDNGQDRLQSAWHRWDLGPSASVVAIAVVASDLRLLVSRSIGGVTEVSSEIIYLSSGQLRPRLDRLMELYVGSHVEVTGRRYTQVALPYTPADVPHALAVVSGPRPAGAVYPMTISNVGGTYIGTVAGDLTGCTVQVGALYSMRAVLGTLLMREQAGSGTSAVTRGRTQVARIAVKYSDSATFAVEVAVEGRDTITHKASGTVLGSGVRGRIGVAALTSGEFSCPVLSENTKATITIVNDTASPSSFTSVDWEGNHVSRGRHVG